MQMFIKVVVACMVAVMLMSCAGRRARQAEQREMMMQQLRQQQPVGASCTSPAAGPCPVCTVQCPVGQPALCSPGESRGDTCRVEPVCKCGAPSS